MFATSTHRKHWMFPSERDVVEKRNQTHDEFVQKYSHEQRDFLTQEECFQLIKFFERKLKEFCIKFKPPMPKGTQGTAIMYYKRFYLNKSAMDYHPKEILVTAAYLACKVEEFNVSIEQFIANINGNKERATSVILNSELLLMQELQFHLTIHLPYRPVEGLMVDIKTRFPSVNPENFRSQIEKFLNDVQDTNACLIYAPSQIALAAVIHAASKAGQNVDSYVTDVLFATQDGSDNENLGVIIEAVRNVRLMVKNLEPVTDIKAIKPLLEKLEKCRNQDNNPDSSAYKRKLQALLNEDDEPIDYESSAKMAKTSHSPRMPGITALH